MDRAGSRQCGPPSPSIADVLWDPGGASIVAPVHGDDSTSLSRRHNETSVVYREHPDLQVLGKSIIDMPGSNKAASLSHLSCTQKYSGTPFLTSKDSEMEQIRVWGGQAMGTCKKGT